MRYYDTKLKCEVLSENENTIKSTDDRVSFFFKELPSGKDIKFDNYGIPYLVDIEKIDENLLIKEKKINEYKKYLIDTDFHIIKAYETGENINSEILEKRKNARDFIRMNEI